MKKVVLVVTIVFLGMFTSCEQTCDCQYVTYDTDENGNWKESYRSTWDASCDSETLDESKYTSWDGTVSYSRTEIECR